MFTDVQLLQQQQQQKSSLNSASYSSKNINKHGNKLPVEYEDTRNIGTIPTISVSFSPIGRNIVIPKPNRFSERKKVHNWQYFGKQDASYYKPQPATDSLHYQPQPDKYNQHQQYWQHRRT